MFFQTSHPFLQTFCEKRQFFTNTYQFDVWFYKNTKWTLNGGKNETKVGFLKINCEGLFLKCFFIKTLFIEKSNNWNFFIGDVLYWENIIFWKWANLDQLSEAWRFDEQEYAKAPFFFLENPYWLKWKDLKKLVFYLDLFEIYLWNLWNQKRNIFQNLIGQ